MYTPENGASIGAAVLRYFRLPGASRLSKLGATTQLSHRGEWELNLDTEHWFAGDRWSLAGKTKISSQEQRFFGVGNDTELMDLEEYSALRFDARLEGTRRLGAGLYAGLIYVLRAEDVEPLTMDGPLGRGEVVGADGGFLSGLGLTLRWDTRDNCFAPRSGWLIHASPRIFHRALGSQHDFARLQIDGSVYFNPFRDHVLAFDGRADLRAGDTPFDELAFAGGKRYLRGMLEGRLRDDYFVTAQTEYRFPLFWRLGGVGFAGLGKVAGSASDLRPTDLSYSVGGGLRVTLDQTERVNLRLDVARTNEGAAFYLALLEAF
jgi:outer membrane protein assembly factor BamA